MKRFLQNFVILAALCGLFSHGAFAQMPGTFQPLVSVAGGVGAPDCTGGTISHVAGNTIHTFTTSGTITCTVGKSVSYLVVAGGGGGGGSNTNVGAGGGGAGGLLQGTGAFLAIGSSPITIGSGGIGSIPTAYAASGGNSSIQNIATAIGGGAGGTYLYGGGAAVPLTGGSGGGGYYSSAGAAGTPGQGFAGSAGPGAAPNYPGGAGGGCGAVGGTTTGAVGGTGGPGCTTSITGTSVCYAGGGGAGTYNGGTAGAATCGGGAGAPPTTTSVSVGFDGAPNTGGGAGGASFGGSLGQTGGNGGTGGSGFAAISYVTGSSQLPPPCAPNTDGGGTFANVIGLWHFDNSGSDAATTPHTLTLNGGAVYSATQSKFGGYALNIVTAGTSYAQVAAGLAIATTGDATIEGWIYWPVAPGNYGWLADDASTFYGQYGNPNMNVQIGGANVTSSQNLSTITVNTWHHLAWTRRGSNGVVAQYLDGNAITMSGTALNNAIGAAGTPWKIGRGYPSNFVMPANSYIDEVRVSNIVRYSSNFTPPTVAFCNN